MSEQQEPRQDALDDVFAAFHRMSVPARPTDAQVLARLDAEGAVPSQASNRRAYLTRFLVPSAAAVALVIGVIALLLLNGATSRALADVVKAAAKHNLVRYHEENITDAKTQTSTVYADFKAPRLRSESRIEDSSGSSILLSVHDGKRHLTTDSRLKTARLDPAPGGYRFLLCCLQDFQKKNGVTHQKGELDGRTTDLYRHVDGKQITTVWVDPASQLPLRFEQEFIEPSPGVARTVLVWTDFVWDPALPPGFGNWDELFSTQPPAGYALDDRTALGKK